MMPPQFTHAFVFVPFSRSTILSTGGNRSTAASTEPNAPLRTCEIDSGMSGSVAPPDGVKAPSTQRSVLDTLSLTLYLAGEASAIFKIAAQMTRSQLFRHFGADHVYEGEKNCRCKTKHLQLQSVGSAQLRSQNTLQFGQEKHVFIEK